MDMQTLLTCRGLLRRIIQSQGEAGYSQHEQYAACRFDGSYSASMPHISTSSSITRMLSIISPSIGLMIRCIKRGR
jgi:hypothetical protein